MASQASIAERRQLNVQRIVRALDVDLPQKRNIPNGAEWNLMNTLGSIADALEVLPLENIPGVPYDLAAATDPKRQQQEEPNVVDAD
jgi:hypothetical protein